jgi:hypothetical protein
MNPTTFSRRNAEVSNRYELDQRHKNYNWLLLPILGNSNREIAWEEEEIIQKIEVRARSNNDQRSSNARDYSQNRGSSRENNSKSADRGVAPQRDYSQNRGSSSRENNLKALTERLASQRLFAKQR